MKKNCKQLEEEVLTVYSLSLIHRDDCEIEYFVSLVSKQNSFFSIGLQNACQNQAVRKTAPGF